MDVTFTSGATSREVTIGATTPVTHDRSIEMWIQLPFPFPLK